jgi:hypothetical protein
MGANTVYVELPSGTILETDRPDLWKEAKRVPKRVGETKLREESLTYLRGILFPGDTVYCVLRGVSSSGMYRRISLLAAPRDGTTSPIVRARAEPFVIDGYAIRVGIGSRPRGRADGIGVGGCGMDMGFALVYELSQMLFPNGYGCIGKGCPSNDHSNGDRDYTLHAEPGTGLQGVGFAHWHKSGGYALKHKWL